MTLYRWRVLCVGTFVFVFLLLSIRRSALPAWYQNLGSLELISVFFSKSDGQDLKQAQAWLGNSSRVGERHALSNYYRLGLVKLYLGDNYAAMAEFARAVELADRERKCELIWLDSYISLADTMQASGENRAALASLDHLLAITSECEFHRYIAPRLARLYIRAGRLSYELYEDIDVLERYYRNAVGLDKTTYWVLHRLIELYVENEEYARAIDVHNRLLEVAPDDGRTFYCLGVIRYHQGYYTSAIEALSRAASLRPQDEFIWLWLGLSHLALGDSRSAVCQFAHCRELNPSCAACYEQLARAFEQQGRPDAALASLLVAYYLDQVHYSWVLLKPGINEIEGKNYHNMVDENIIENKCK